MLPLPWNLRVLQLPVRRIFQVQVSGGTSQYGRSATDCIHAHVHTRVSCLECDLKNECIFVWVGVSGCARRDEGIDGTGQMLSAYLCNCLLWLCVPVTLTCFSVCTCVPVTLNHLSSRCLLCLSAPATLLTCPLTPAVPQCSKQLLLFLQRHTHFTAPTPSVRRPCPLALGM